MAWKKHYTWPYGFTTSLISFGLWHGVLYKSTWENAHQLQSTWKKTRGFYTHSSANTYFLGTLQKNHQNSKNGRFWLNLCMSSAFDGILHASLWKQPNKMTSVNYFCVFDWPLTIAASILSISHTHQVFGCCKKNILSQKRNFSNQKGATVFTESLLRKPSTFAQWKQVRKHAHFFNKLIFWPVFTIFLWKYQFNFVFLTKFITARLVTDW